MEKQIPLLTKCALSDALNSSPRYHTSYVQLFGVMAISVHSAFNFE